MPNSNTKQIILVSPTAAENPVTSDVGGFVPLIVNGGIAVVVIVALAYFSQTQLKAIAHLFTNMNKN